MGDAGQEGKRAVPDGLGGQRPAAKPLAKDCARLCEFTPVQVAGHRGAIPKAGKQGWSSLDVIEEWDA